MKEVLVVFAGGGLGSVLRYAIARLLQNLQPVFPFATLTVNFLSCVVFGAALWAGAEKLHMSHQARLFILTGFCGGFSTYSAFAYETAELFKSQQTALALSNIVLNFALSVSGLYLGMLATRLFIN